MTDLGLYYRKVKRATEEDSSTLEWLNGHFNNLKFTFSEELEKLDNDTNSGSMESLPIDAGANITVAISMLLIMTYAMRHSLLGEALADLPTLHYTYLENTFKTLKAP